MKPEFIGKRIFKRNYPMTEPQKLEAHNQLKEWHNAGIVGPATDRASYMYSSPLLLVKRRVGRDRLVIDLRACNSAVVPCVVELHKLQELIENASSKNGKYFTSIDFRQSYLQCKLDENTNELLTVSDPVDGSR